MVIFGGKLRTLAIASTLLGLATVQASACARGFPLAVFFDRVPDDAGGFVVLGATLVESQSLVDETGTWMFMGVARIDRVINGEVDGKTVKLFRYINPCEMYRSESRRGIVVGTLRKGTQNELEVVTVTQWDWRTQALRERK
jgi:hypothetical protein